MAREIVKRQVMFMLECVNQSLVTLVVDAVVYKVHVNHNDEFKCGCFKL